MSRELDFIDFINENADEEEITPRYQFRETRGFSSRSLLANASIEDMQDTLEKDMLLKYQDVLQQLQQKMQELQDNCELLSNIYAGNDKYYLSMKQDLQEAMTVIASQRDNLDRQLMELEQSPTLQKVIERERDKAFKRREAEAEQRRNEERERYRERIAETERELKARYQESRQKAMQKRKQEQEQPKPVIETKTPDQLKPKQHNEVSSIKEKLTNTLGGLGIVLFYVLNLIIYILPFVMIGGNFFVTLLLIAINMFVPFASAIFWIWGLICAIKGVQDIWAIIYYIAFVVIWIPFYISTLLKLFSKKN